MSPYFLNPALLKPTVVDNSGDIFVSKRIVSTIQECITSPPSEIRTKMKELTKDYERQQNHQRIQIDYDDPVLLDAYTINYLPRNTLIPKLGLFFYSYSATMFSNQDRLNILDIGSGTGAIPLGLLDMFQEPSLRHIKCDIYAIDSLTSALHKQNKLIKTYGLDGSTHDYDYADLSDPATYRKILKNKQPFDLIFCSNILSEMKYQHIENILSIIHNNLDNNGVCIIAESQNTPAKRACAYLSHHVDEYGLHVFYPCPPDISCTNPYCWKWFNHYFVCDDIQIGDEEFEITKKHTIFWRIITKQDLSVYQYLNSKRKNYNWGITRYARNKSCNEFCTENGQFDGTISPALAYHGPESPWSQIMGISDGDERIRVQWNPINDFKSCNSKINSEE